MAPAKKDIFKKVSVSERKTLFREMVKARDILTIKGETEDPFHLIAIQVEKDEFLMCHHTADSKGQSKPQTVVANFTHENDQYFCRTDLTFNLNWAILKLDLDLFKLQRRASARIEIPDEINAEFILKQFGPNKYDVICKVKDVSTGGIKAEMPIGAPDLKIGDTVQGILRFGNRRPFEFELEARFVQKISTGEVITEQTSVPYLPSNQVQITGFQFLKIDSVIESRMLTILMDIQREIYIKTVKKR
jgi:hypothetical protein